MSEMQLEERLMWRRTITVTKPLVPSVCFVAWQGYKLEEMTPAMVHYGTMPQDVLDRENESVRLLLERNGKPPRPIRKASVACSFAWMAKSPANYFHVDVCLHARPGLPAGILNACACAFPMALLAGRRCAGDDVARVRERNEAVQAHPPRPVPQRHPPRQGAQLRAHPPTPARQRPPQHTRYVHTDHTLTLLPLLRSARSALQGQGWLRSRMLLLASAELLVSLCQAVVWTSCVPRTRWCDTCRASVRRRPCWR